MNPVTWAAAVGISSFLLTPLARRLALRIGLTDSPNERTLHTGEVARGAGVAFVIPFLAAVALAWSWEHIPGRLAFGLLVGAGGVSAVAFSDDLRPKPPLLRLALWCPPLLATLLAYGGLPTLDLGFTRLPWGPAGTVLALIGGLWLVTLYNFMDGIHGLAAGQAVVTAAAGAALLGLDGANPASTLCACLAAGAAGFWVWNARGQVFMGDVGAAFLGACFAVLGLHTESTGSLPLLTWLILLMPFLVDTTFTLIRRIGSGRPWGRAHREHAYQRAVLSGRSHARVAMAFIALDLVLVGLAWLSSRQTARLAELSLLSFLGTGCIWLGVRRATKETSEGELDSSGR